MGIVIVILLGLLGWVAYRYLSQNRLEILRSELPGSKESPEEILDRRLAEGKIDREQYRQIRQTLRS
jgi:uncharacterized membrane protein